MRPLRSDKEEPIAAAASSRKGTGPPVFLSRCLLASFLAGDSGARESSLAPCSHVYELKGSGGPMAALYIIQWGGSPATGAAAELPSTSDRMGKQHL